MSDKHPTRGRGVLPAVALGLATCQGALTAMAAESGAEPALQLKYSVTPFLGYRFGGSFAVADADSRADVVGHLSFGVAFDMATDEQRQYELFYSRQSTHLGTPAQAPSDVVVEYLHVGGIVLYGESQRFRPYIIGTLGGTRFSPQSPGRDSINFSVSLGAGLRIPLNDHLALRLEARGYATFFDTHGTVFCHSGQTGGVCQIQGTGSTFLQGDVLAGVAYTF